MGIEAVQRLSKRGRYFSTVESTNALEQEKSTGRQGKIAPQADVRRSMIFDELGYQSFSRPRRALMSHLR
ncbi:ATP-binding protein [Burkholderia vietnamiensis]|nr:ATP-binding protein [Burkholderia vietnamiensis]